MIGGQDIVVDSSFTGPSTIKIIGTKFLGWWSQGVVESDKSNDVITINAFRDLDLNRYDPVPCEYFFYRTREARESWTRDGRTDANHDDMVYVIFEMHQITFVISEDASEQTRTMITSISSFLR